MDRLRRCCVIAFAIPFLGMLAVMAFFRCAPFGEGSFLYCDMYHQYFPFFTALRRSILQGNSLVYDWSLGLGTDKLALIAYYLASPLNLISLALPESALMGYFSLLMPMKLGFAGCFFCLFLCHSFRRTDFSVCLFGASYALCAWALGYQWNIMWLDSFAMLPLVVLGMQKLLQEGKPILYTFSLFFAVAANYYIGFFICLFVALLFLCHCICNFRPALLGQLGKMALYSGLALAMTAFLTFPALYALRNTHGITGAFPKWKMGLDLFQAMGQVAGGTVPTFLKGLPNIACTTAAAFFALIHFVDKGVSRKRRLCSLGLLAFLLFSFCLKPLDYIWHGFHYPNMIPYRYSFLFSFVLLTAGYQGFLSVPAADPRHFLLAAFGCSLLFLSCGFGVWLYGGCVLMGYAFCLPGFQKAWGRLCVAGLLIAELSVSVIGFAVNYPGKGVSLNSYPIEKESVQALLNYARQKEQSFFRVETSYAQTLNDSALNGYNGISCFTSTANASVTRLMRAMGLAAWEGCNRYCYELGSPVSTLFLNLKYLLHRQDHTVESVNFLTVARSGNVTLLENQAWLPLGFLADAALEDFDFFRYDDPFSMENGLLKASAGVTEDIWVKINGEDRGNIRRFTADREGLFCVNVGACPDGVFSFYRNGKLLFHQRYSLPQVFGICNVRQGDVIEVRIQADKTSVPITGAILREDVFWQAYSALSRATAQWEFVSDTQLSCSIVCPKSGIVYTSIPQDGNWQVTVDGTVVTPVLIGDAMLGIPLSQGMHTIQLSYKNKAFSLGWVVSLGALTTFVCIHKRKKAIL